MKLTDSYAKVFPERVLSRYCFAETRNAAAILQVTNPVALAELIQCLDAFSLYPQDLSEPGGQESALAARLNASFREFGWREAQVNTKILLELKRMPYKPTGETTAVVTPTETASVGYKVDNYKDRVALDVEWNAKDGNLDRDIAAYRFLYDSSLIDVAVIISRTQDDLRKRAFEIGISMGKTEAEAKKPLSTTTTTNITKLLPRLKRGDGGGCPILAVFISADTEDKTER